MSEPTMAPFLDFPIPEIGAEPGDWITLHHEASPPQLVLVRRLSDHEVEQMQRHMKGVAAFLARLPHREPVGPVGLPPLEVVP